MEHTVQTIDGQSIPLDSIEQFVDTGTNIVARIGHDYFTLKPEVNRRLLSALDYADSGWFCFPVPVGSKKSHKSAEYSGGRKWGMTRDKSEIIADWRTWPDANVGLPTGEINGFFVIEADTNEGHAVDGLASLAALEAANGALPETLMAISPSGSVHRYYKHPGFRVANSASAIAPGVDIRGDGGMVVAPPSVRSDGAYHWLNSFDIAEAPQWLLDMLRQAERETPEDDESLPRPSKAKVRAALAVLNADCDYESWLRLGASCKDFKEEFREFSMKSDKYHGDKEFNEKWREMVAMDQITIGSLFHRANEVDPDWDKDAVISLNDFVSYLPEGCYVYLRTLAYWPGSSVNKRLPWIRVGYDKDKEPIMISPTAWLDSNRRVEVQTWLPGQPTLIEGHEFTESDGLLPMPDSTTFNQYAPPTIIIRNADRDASALWIG